MSKFVYYQNLFLQLSAVLRSFPRGFAVDAGARGLGLEQRRSHGQPQNVHGKNFVFVYLFKLAFFNRKKK